jgi:iron only hydrogenase large subunit-like protein
MRRLAAYGKAAAEKAATDANLVEVMACPGGCIAGPSVIANPKVALGLLGKYVSSGKGGA